MTIPGGQPAFDSTSTSGAAVLRQFREPMFAGFMFLGLGTSSAPVLPDVLATATSRPAEQTTAGAPIVLAAPAGPAIAELRRFTGFTWDQLARLFGVSRRALHFWASGKAMTPSNEEHLQRLQAVVRKIDRGSAQENRSVLLTARDDGTIPFDLLASGQYEQVCALFGPGGARRLSPRKLSEEAMSARAPRPPGELVDALQDRVHHEIGIGRAAKSMKVRGGG